MASRTVYSFGKTVSLSYSILTIKLWCRRSKYFMPLLQIKKSSLLDPSDSQVYRFSQQATGISLFTTLQRCDSVSPLPQHRAAGQRPSSLTTKNKNPAWHHPKDQWRCFPPKLKCKIDTTNNLQVQIWHLKIRTLREQSKRALYSEKAISSGEGKRASLVAGSGHTSHPTGESYSVSVHTGRPL